MIMTCGAIALTALLTLSGCGTDDDSGIPPGMPDVESGHSYINDPASGQLIRQPDPWDSLPTVNKDPRCQKVPNPVPGSHSVAYRCDATLPIDQDPRCELVPNPAHNLAAGEPPRIWRCDLGG